MFLRRLKTIFKKPVWWGISLAFCFPLTVAAQNTTSLLAEYTKSAFEWAIGFAAILAAIAFIAGAIQYTISFDSPQKRGDGKNRMLSSLLGLLLCLGAVLVLNTINPKLVRLEFGQAIGEKNTGLYYTNGKPEEDRGAHFSVSDTSVLFEAKYNTITYFCKDVDPQRPPRPAIIWLYPETGFKDKDPEFKKTTVKKIACGEEAKIDGKSFRIEYERSGVYLFMDKNCTGYQSQALLINANPLSLPFRAKAKSFKLISYPEDESWYGIIFHESEKSSDSDKCSEPFIQQKPGSQGDCFSLENIQPVSATIVNTAKLVYSVPASYSVSGLGAKLYSKPWGWELRSFAGFSDQTITTGESLAGRWDKGITASRAEFKHRECSFRLFGGQGRDCETATYKAMCKTFEDCPGSIQLIGNFLLVLSTDGQYGQKVPGAKDTSTCQTFYSDINSIKELEFSGEGNRVRSVKVIPLK